MTDASPFLTEAVIHEAKPGSRPFEATDAWAVPRVGVPVPSPDGSACVVGVTTYDVEENESSSRLWLVPANGGEPRALTSTKTDSSQPSYAPDGQRIAFVRKCGNGKAQVHVLPLDGGEAEPHTELPLGTFDPRWLPDGSGIVFGAELLKGHLTPEATAAELERREKDPVKAHVTEDRFYRFWDRWLTTGKVPHLFHLDLATGAVRDLMPDAELWFGWMDPSGHFDVSPDGAQVAFEGIYFDEERSLVRSALFVLPMEGGTPRCLTADHPGDDTAPRWTPDGTGLLYGMTHDPTFYADRVRLMRWDAATDTHTPVLDDWDLSPAHWEFADDGSIVIQAQRRARTALFRLPSGGAVPELLVADGTCAFSRPPAGGGVVFSSSTLRHPAEVHRLDLATGAVQRLSGFADAVMADVQLGEVREVTFRGALDETVQMFVVLPPGYEEGRRYPLVHAIHGGPHGVSPEGFGFRWNSHLFAAPGYVAAMVNFQGSSSFGQDFAQRIQGAWGDLPYGDVMRATDALVAAGLADEDRMAVTGGSYGGYMVSWITCRTSRFKCGVNHAGVHNMLSHYATDITQGRGRSFGGEPWDGIEGLDRWNPARFAAGVETPTLVIHGELDYRVPYTQALECYNVLKAKGVPARLVMFPDENHWVLKPRNSLLWTREVHAWLARFL